MKKIALERLENLLYEYKVYEKRGELTRELHMYYFYDVEDIRKLYKVSTEEYNRAWDRAEERAIKHISKGA